MRRDGWHGRTMWSRDFECSDCRLWGPRGAGWRHDLTAIGITVGICLMTAGAAITAVLAIVALVT